MILGYMISESAATVAEDVVLKRQLDRVVAQARLQTAGEKNRNGRIYPKSELFPQLTCARTKELLEAGYMRAESGHPMSQSLTRQQTIDPSNTCAIFQKFWTSGNDVYGQFIGTNNALGEAFNKDLLDGYKPAWSLRALGSIETTNEGAVVKNLKLITYDHVIYPSHPGAYTTGIVSESAGNSDMAYNNGFYVPRHTLQLLDENAQNLSDSMNAETEHTLEINNDSVVRYIKSESMNLKQIQESFDVLCDSITLTEDSKVQMKTKEGDCIIINLERYIQNEIMDYCAS